MGSELARKRVGQPTKTKMSEQQLREFAGSVKGGSLEDIVYHEEAATCEFAVESANGVHALHKGYSGGGQKTPDSLGAIQWGADRGWKEDGDEPKGSVMSSNRDNGWGIHYGAKVDYFGPDTDYRAEEIDPHQYGRDWEPIPFRDYYKTEDDQFDRGLRLREQDEYDQTITPGAVTESQPMSEAYGARNFRDIDKERGKEIADYRNFDAQRRFARSSKDKSQEYAVDITGHDTKKGSKIR